MQEGDEEVVLNTGRETPVNRTDPVAAAYLARLITMRNEANHLSADELDTLQGAIFALRRLIDTKGETVRKIAQLESTVRGMKAAIVEFASKINLTF